MLAARNADKRLASLCEDLKIRYEASAIPIEFDALEFEKHPAFYDNLPHTPDVAVCVFGLMGEHDVAIKNFTESHRIIDSNYTGAISILNVVANDFEKRQHGVIIGISSVAGDRGRQSNYIYGSAKAGFNAYLSGLRNRLHPSGVKVMTVKPGFVNTRMTERLALPPVITAQPEMVAKDIFKAHQKGKSMIYTRWFWKYIMLIVTSIPECIFKRLKL